MQAGGAPLPPMIPPARGDVVVGVGYPENPKIIILMGSTAMECLTGINGKISDERGKWKEIIIKDKTFPVMITFSASYLPRQ